MVRKLKHIPAQEESPPDESNNDEEDPNLASQGRDDVDDLLAEMDADVVIDDPDEMILAKEAEEIIDLPDDESRGLFKTTSDTELGEDPVRLYLSEIGEIELLSVDHEFWLATRIEAARRGEVLNRGHPIARHRRESSTRIYRAVIGEVGIGWER